MIEVINDGDYDSEDDEDDDDGYQS